MGENGLHYEREFFILRQYGFIMHFLVTFCQFKHLHGSLILFAKSKHCTAKKDSVYDVDRKGRLCKHLQCCCNCTKLPHASKVLILGLTKTTTFETQLTNKHDDVSISHTGFDHVEKITKIDND